MSLGTFWGTAVLEAFVAGVYLVSILQPEFLPQLDIIFNIYHIYR